MFNCFNCNKKMIWYSDFDLREYFPNKDKDGVVSVGYCKDCDKLLFYIFTYDENKKKKLDSILTEESILL